MASKHTITLTDGVERELFFSVQSLAEIAGIVGGVDKFGAIQAKFLENPGILGKLVYEGLYTKDGTPPSIEESKIARMIPFDQTGAVMSAFFEAIGAKNEASAPADEAAAQATTQTS